jgi:hypothetical protein
MYQQFTAAVFAVATLIAYVPTAEAVLVGLTLPSDTIEEGTTTFDFTLSFDGTINSEAFFSSFTYAIEATNSRVGADPAFFKPISSSNLEARLSGWTVVDQSSGGGPNQLAGNVFAPPATQAALPNDVFLLTLDTSGLRAGDTITINPDLFGSIATVANLGVDARSVGDIIFANASFSVVAVPEPSTLSVLGGIMMVGLVRRRRVATGV